MYWWVVEMAGGGWHFASCGGCVTKWIGIYQYGWKSFHTVVGLRPQCCDAPSNKKTSFVYTSLLELGDSTWDYPFFTRSSFFEERRSLFRRYCALDDNQLQYEWICGFFSPNDHSSDLSARPRFWLSVCFVTDPMWTVLVNLCLIMSEDSMSQNGDSQRISVHKLWIMPVTLKSMIDKWIVT
jgi:hypothetical protein